MNTNENNVPVGEEIEVQLALVQTDPFEREGTEQEYYAWLAEGARSRKAPSPAPAADTRPSIPA